MTNAVDDLLKKNKKKNQKIKDFAQILDGLESTEDKKKLLWKEIYENALNDRENANVLFTDLLLQSKGNAANHSIHSLFGRFRFKSFLESKLAQNEKPKNLKFSNLVVKFSGGPQKPRFLRSNFPQTHFSWK